MISDVDTPALFYLDGHKNEWFSGGTQPLQREIDIIGNHPIKNHTIIVDDYKHLGGFDNISIIIKQKINPDYNFEKVDERNGILVAYI